MVLRDKLDKFKDSSKDELNKLFKKQLRSKNNNILSKGAGLGLIDIIRKCDTMEYYFSTLDSGETFYTLKVEYNI